MYRIAGSSGGWSVGSRLGRVQLVAELAHGAVRYAVGHVLEGMIKVPA